MRITESRSITFTKEQWSILDKLIQKNIIESISIFINNAVQEKLKKDLDELTQQKNELDFIVNNVINHKEMEIDDFNNLTTGELEKFAFSLTRLVRFRKISEEIELTEPKIEEIPL